MSVQVGSVLATRIYTAGEKPYYAKGNLALISLACLSIVLCWLAKLYTLEQAEEAGLGRPQLRRAAAVQTQHKR
jgi:hypothetical protein